MSFAAIRKNKANLAKMQDQVAAQAGGSKPADPRKWKHSFDKNTKIGTSVIRVLPRYDANGEQVCPWVGWTEYSFEGITAATKNKKYWHRSLANIGQNDPVAELNNAHWARIPEAEKKNGADAALARQRNLKKRYVCNIVVINDPVKPENNGKVFLYEFGPSIQEKFELAMYPKFQDQAPLAIQDWFEGANFTIRSCEGKNGWMSYDDSSFGAPEAIAGGNEQVMEHLYNSLHDLGEFESEDNYKTYDELRKEMIGVLGAKFVADILGEQYNPAEAAAAGSNPFVDGAQAEPQAEPQAQQQSGGFNPAQAQQQQTETQQQTDPFAGVTQKQQAEPEAQKDPFAGAGNTGVQAEPEAQKDPFAGVGNDAAADDPFANIKL